MPTRLNRLFRLYAAQKKPLDLTFLLKEGDEESAVKEEQDSMVRKDSSAKKLVTKGNRKGSPGRERSS